MISARIPGFTRELAKDQEDYRRLWIRDESVQVADRLMNAMTSAWEPTPQQIEALVAGGKIYLQILGNVHPPVCLWVEAATVEKPAEEPPANPPVKPV